MILVLLRVECFEFVFALLHYVFYRSNAKKNTFLGYFGKYYSVFYGEYWIILSFYQLKLIGVKEIHVGGIHGLQKFILEEEKNHKKYDSTNKELSIVPHSVYKISRCEARSFRYLYSLLIAVTFTHARRRLDGFFVLTTEQSNLPRVGRQLTPYCI